MNRKPPGKLASALGLLVACAALFALALYVYRSNDGFLYTYDSAPTSLFVFNALEHHTLAFDAFRNGYFYAFGAGYIFTQTPTGHLAPIFPIGTALLTAPIYLFDYARAVASAPFPDISAIGFEPARLRYEKDAAAILGAVTAVVFFLCARRLAPMAGALVATVAFAFGTEMWTIGSQALWQHGAINLVMLAMTYTLLRESRAREPLAIAAWLAFAGLCAGFLPVVRPTAAAFLLAGLAFAVWHRRERAWPFVAGACAGIAPGLTWNLAVFHSFIGGYAVDSGSFTFTLQQVVGALGGLFVSPSKGLIVYTPLVVVSAIGLVRAFRNPEPEARLIVFLAGACALIVANYTFYQAWIGGSSFGPRFLTDVSSVCALLLIFAFPTFEMRRRMRSSTYFGIAVFAILLCYSIGVQTAGANGEPKSAWSDVPEDVATHPERVWTVRDSQIERDALAIDRLWRTNPTFTAAYPDGFHGRVLGAWRGASDGAPQHALEFAPGEAADMTALAENVGPSRWFGYDTGVYFGQARVRARIYASDGGEVSESYLYIAGSPENGARIIARGSMRAPQKPGRYEAVFDVDCFQVAAVSGRVGAPALRAALFVR